MVGKHTPIYHPVKREGAEDYLLLSLISFGTSVMLTRLFLEITNYPQLGNNELHIAHVLWGGLILFAATLFPLIFANRWALTVSALLSGIGVGLFIDEIGKFITQSNNYFYPPAAPIIYAFFLITVLVYMQVRRAKTNDPRAEMYKSLSILTEVLDSDLDSDERTNIHASLLKVQNTSVDPAMIQLSKDLMTFIASEAIPIAPLRLPLVQRWQARVKYWLESKLPRIYHRIMIIFGLFIMGFNALYDLWTLLSFSVNRAQNLQGFLWLRIADISASPDMLWHLIRLGLEGAVGILAFASVLFLLIKKELQGIYLATLGLLLQLTAVDLLVFYLDQFSAAIATILQLLLLLLIINYRRRYLDGITASR